MVRLNDTHVNKRLQHIHLLHRESYMSVHVFIEFIKRVGEK